MIRLPSLPTAVIVTVSLALIAAAGCTTILGVNYTYEGTGGGTTTTATTSATTGTGGASMCGTFSWSPEATCQACMQKECCGELLACTDGTPCATLAACVAKCAETDDVCLGSCLATDTSEHQSSGGDAYYAIVSCFGVNCQGGNQCDFPICNSGFTWSIDACAQCLSTSCCAAFTACDGVCTTCLQNPTQMGCSGSATYQAAQACVSGTCGQVCADLICTSPQFAYTSPRCNECLSQSTGGCCPSITACAADMTCSACFYSGAASCSSNQAYANFGSCYESNCVAQCSGFF